MLTLFTILKTLNLRGFPRLHWSADTLLLVLTGQIRMFVDNLTLS